MGIGSRQTWFMFCWATGVDTVDHVFHILSGFLLKRAAFLPVKKMPDCLKIILSSFANDWFMNGRVNPNWATEK